MSGHKHDKSFELRLAKRKRKQEIKDAAKARRKKKK